jgi:hypothetical protein
MGCRSCVGLADPRSARPLEAVWAKLAAPGMCNPDHDTRPWTAHPLQRPSTVTPGARPNANTTRSMRDAKNDILRPRSRFKQTETWSTWPRSAYSTDGQRWTFCAVLECRDATLQYARQGTCVNWTALVAWYPAGFPQAGTL